MNKATVAVDAMSGDHGCKVVVPAVLQMLEQYPQLAIILVGDQDTLEKQLAKHDAKTSERLIIQHASEVVTMDEKPSQALRGKKDSSMRVAINLVSDKKADACVSAGNTGALMATARFVLKTLPGIDRPAIMGKLPTRNSTVYMLDLGANVDSRTEHLYQFAVMGSILAESVGGIKNPKVALLNIGEEEMKGNEQVKQTAKLLSECGSLNYVGYIEGNAMFTGTVDVVVCDGFVGNVAIKSSEGLAKLIGYFMRKGFTESKWSMLVGLLAKPILKRLKDRLDPAKYNAGLFLGLRGTVVKSHGGSKQEGFVSAIREAMLQAETNVPEQISARVAELLVEETSEMTE